MPVLHTTYRYLMPTLTGIATLLLTTFAQTTGSRLSTIPIPNDSTRLIIESLAVQLDSTRYYNPAYVALDYPGGDVPLVTGVCADVVVRALRNANLDLQVAIHQDMKKNFRKYPQLWGLKKPDRNIDHRRVANQMQFFENMQKDIAITADSSHYLPGDIVAWMLPGNLYHVGIVAQERSPHSGLPLIVHNIGRGTQSHDCLFAWKIIGHYRWFQ